MQQRKLATMHNNLIFSYPKLKKIGEMKLRKLAKEVN